MKTIWVNFKEEFFIETKPLESDGPQDFTEFYSLEGDELDPMTREDIKQLIEAQRRPIDWVTVARKYRNYPDCEYDKLDWDIIKKLVEKQLVGEE